MTLENINYIAQTIGVLAILASLIFVGRQLQQAQKIQRAAAQRDLLARVSEFSWKISPIDAESDLFVNGLMEFDDAPARQQGFFAAALADFVFITESALNMHKDGFLSDGTWQGIEGGALSLLRTPGGAMTSA